MKAKKFRIVTFSVVGALLALILAINIACGIFSDTIIRWLSLGNVSAATREAGENLALQIQEEGTVLVRNEKNDESDEKAVLPLSSSVMKVNVFGWAATDWLAGGSGSGRAVNTMTDLHPNTDLLEALEEAGIQYNKTLINMYESFAKERPKFGDSLHSYDYEFSRLIEPAMSDYPTELLAELEAYSQTALVVLGRIAGESNDAPLVQYKGTGSSSKPDDATRTYLDISTEEEALLEYVGRTYENVVVIINSTNQMNLGFLDKIEGLDACLIAGGTGNNAVRGVVNVLYGQVMYASEDENARAFGTPVSPSGKTVDTYAYDFTTNAVYANSGSAGIGAYTGGSGYPIGTTNENVSNKPTYQNVSYLDYVEDIYVGYKWYETADEEGFWDSDFAKNKWGIQNGYDDVVQFPFGFGLSYTTFEWELIEVTPNLSTIDLANLDTEITVTVEVKNTGDYAAQEVVELYYTPPYNKPAANGKSIEKSARNLIAFAKTPTAVEPNGGTQQLDLKFKLSDMASYDSHEVKVTGGGWILEAGTYTLSLMKDAHHVAEVKGGATITYTVASDLKNFDEEQAFNLFTGDSAKDYGISLDGSNTGANIKYLTRSNFETSFPSQRAANRSMDQKLKTYNLYSKDLADAWKNAKDKEAGENGVQMPTTGATPTVKMFEGKIATQEGLLLGSNYYDELWETVLDQLTVNEMKALVQHGYTHEEAISSIGKSETTSLDGPAQIGSFNQSSYGVGYPMPTVLAQTWNQELAKSFGLAAASEAQDIGVDGWYAPGINMHRSAFGGRNYEYYSEDSYLSGIMCAKTTEGSLDGGVYVYIKHIIGYDQESMRDSLYCWMTEQALREIYLKPFKIAIDEGGATGLMSSYGRIGAVWSGGSEALLTHLLRYEWGFNGAVITDYADHQNFMNGDQMLRAGGDLWMDGWLNDGKFANSSKGLGGIDTDSAAFVAQLREASHHVLYMIANAQYVNSTYNAEADNPVVKSGGKEFPLWTIIGVVDGVVVAGCAVWVVFAILKKDKQVTPTAEPAEPIEPADQPKQE